MEKQYYKPKIEEFHPTFRYEVTWNNCEEYHKQTFHVSGLTILGINEMLERGEVRVKSIDHQDIKEAGWVEVRKSLIAVGTYFEKGKFELYFQNGGIIILEGNAEVRFRGKIANYNKLLDVMEMLEIGNNK